MPLVQGSSYKAIAENIARLHRENKNKSRSNAQIKAIAYSIAKKNKS